MIQGILAQSAMAFRGHAPSGMQEQPQHLALTSDCVDTNNCDGGSCDCSRAWQWACESKQDYVYPGCALSCKTHSNGNWDLPWLAEVCGGDVVPPPATQAPPATQPPATQPPATQPPATQPPATQPPATQPPVTQPPPVPCVPVTDAPTDAPPTPATTTKVADVVIPGEVEGYVPFSPPPRNTVQNYMFSSFASGQSGNSSYATMMGVSPQEIVGGVMPYNDLDNQIKSDCMWCDNLWELEWNNPQNLTKTLNHGKYKTHTEYRKVTQSQMNYKDYSVASANDDYIVGAYVTEWSIYRAKGKYGIDAVPFNAALDYVLYGFMPVCGRGFDDVGQLGLCTVQDCTSYEAESNSYFALNQACDGMEPGSVVIHDPWAAFSGYSSMMTLLGESDHPNHFGGFHLLMNAKAEHKDKIRIMPSIGGWSLSKIFFDMHDDTIRHNFVNSAANLLTAWPFFDGIDIDWEFPGGLGADAGVVSFAKAAESDIKNDSYSPKWDKPDKCVQQKVEFTERIRTIHTSWKNMITCDKFSTKEVVTVDIPPLGCSVSKEKRKEIADGYRWGTYGHKNHDDYMDCRCDADIGHMLFTDLRAALDNVPLSERPTEFGKLDRYQITTATSGAVGKINEVDYGRLVAEEKLDHIFIMSYDFMGAWDMNQLGHQTNLFPHADGKATPVSVSESVQAFLSQGVPSEKIMVGVASYGRGWAGSFRDVYEKEDLSAAWSATAVSACKGDIEDGVVDYNTIYEKTTNGGPMKQIWDDCAMAHLTVGESEIYTGDSAESVWAKGDFVRKNKLAGLFTWELSQDSHQAPLLNVMNEALGRSPSTGSVERPDAMYTDIYSSSCYTALEPVNYSNRTFNITCEK